MLTLVGTAPNLVADAALQRAEFAGFGFFTFTPFGTVILGAGSAAAFRWPLSLGRLTASAFIPPAD